MSQRRWSEQARAVAALALLGVACAGAQPDRAQPQLRPTATPLLWHAQAPGAGDFYLLGSVHVGAAGAHQLGPEVAQAYARSSELVVEVDVSHVSPTEVETLTDRYATLPADRTLDSLLASETRERLADFVAARGLPVERMQRFKPWFVSMFVLMTELQAAGYDTELGIDRLFLAEADGAKRIVGLETLDSQFSMLDRLPLSLQELMLKDALVRSDALDDETAALLDAWARGDEAEVERRIFQPLEQVEEMEAFYQAVFWQRNAEMAERIAALAGDGETRFVVLGAGHMVGARGVPALLGSRGFRVERIGADAAASPPAAPAAP